MVQSSLKHRFLLAPIATPRVSNEVLVSIRELANRVIRSSSAGIVDGSEQLSLKRRFLLAPIATPRVSN